jgi:hypothetical protein
MELPRIVKNVIIETTSLLKVYIENYMKSLNRTVKEDQNRVDYTFSIPTEKDFETYIYKALKEICDNGMDNMSVSYDDRITFNSKHDDDIIWLVIEGYQMPVIVHFGLADNTWENGSVDASVWINDYVAQKI